MKIGIDSDDRWRLSIDLDDGRNWTVWDRDKERALIRLVDELARYIAEQPECISRGRL